jgi:hypothetical protein
MLALDEQRSEIVRRLVSQSMTTVTKIIEKAEQAQVSSAFKALFDFKGQRVEIEYQKTLAI